MIIRIHKLQLRFYANILEKRTGICSQHDSSDDKHALLMDFDNSSLSKIINDMYTIQLKYNLPTIYIIASSSYSYHAYCFTGRPFMQIIHILSDIPEIDESYFRLGIVRGYFTLRITPRKNDKFKIVKILASCFPEEMKREELTINEYLTSNKGNKTRRIKNAEGK